MPADSVELIKLALVRADNILVITHIGPDGDAISSLTAVGLMLQEMGKSFTLVCDDGLPSRYHFLPLSSCVVNSPDLAANYDLIITVDAADLGRLGQAYTSLETPLPEIINIDHHRTNAQFGQINLILPGANSTTEILAQITPELDLELSPNLATCLLTGLVTDTLSFSTAGTNAQTLRIAADLIDAGADLYSVTSQAMKLNTLSTLLIWQAGLRNMKHEDGLFWTTINDEERSAAGHQGGSSFGLGNMMADVYQAAMSAVLVEMSDGTVSVGFRCRPPFSVSGLAKSLGGGGHDLAAGCSLEGPLNKAEAQVVARSKEFIKRQKANR